MLPNSALTAVELVIPSDKYFDAMSDIGDWLAGRRVTSPYSTCRRNLSGDHKVCIAFPRACDARNFAEHFGGRLAA
jgi:hypothetical protein